MWPQDWLVSANGWLVDSESSVVGRRVIVAVVCRRSFPGASAFDLRRRSPSTPLWQRLDPRREAAARPVGAVSGVEDIPAVWRSREAGDLPVVSLQPQRFHWLGLALLDRIQRRALRIAADEETAAGGGRVDRVGRLDVGSVCSPPQDFLDLGPRRVADVDEGDRVAIDEPDDGYERPVADPARV